MPPYRQPCLLRDLALINVSELIQDACVTIYNRHKHSQRLRLAEANNLQQYLVSKIWPLLDEICTHTFSNGKTLPLCVAGDVILPVLAHKRMKTLRYPSHPTRRKTSLSRDYGLWEMLVKEMPNLIELDLSGVEYRIDGILRIIGGTCFQLQIICIGESKVSQLGLCHLATVKSLRVIKNSYPDLLYVTKNANDLPCVRLLLLTLPLLEHIHCSCMGEILLDLQHIEPLSLKHCWETQPTPRKIQAIARLCPGLVRLELGHPIVYNRSFELSPLTKSTLHVLSLKLTDFCFTESLVDFFVAKGMFLKELELYNLDDISVEQLKAIGRHCRNLEVLKIDLGLYFDPSYQSTIESQLCFSDERLFEKLLRFEFEVNGQADAIRLLMFLAPAKRIQMLTFWSQSSSGLYDKTELEKVLLKLIGQNPLIGLRSLILVGPFKLSKDLIKYFYDLPNIIALKLDLILTPEVDEFLEGLRNRISQNNIELQHLS